MPKTNELAILLNGRGEKFASGNAFGNWLKDRCREAGLPQCTAHGFRKIGNRIATENGASDKILNAMYCWVNGTQSGTYTRTANNLILATAGFALIAKSLIAKGLLKPPPKNKQRTPVSHLSQG